MEHTSSVNMGISMHYLLATALLTVSAVSAGPCQGKTSDILFLLDASTSVWAPHFRQQLNFVRQVAHVFDIAPSRSRVAALSFATAVRVEFDFGRYSQRTGVLRAVERIQQLYGGTRTDLALSLATELFEDSRRQGIPQVAIVLTDGGSDYPGLTRQAAELLQRDGTQVMAVGIGSAVNEAELALIATREDLVFQVDTFDALDTIKAMLAFSACEVSAPPLALLATESPMLTPPDQVCGARPADIVFVLDASGSIWEPDFRTQLTFVQGIARSFQVSETMTHIGVMTYSDSPQHQFHLDDYYDSDTMSEVISSISQSRGGTWTNKALDAMRRDYFTDDRARPHVAHIGVVITDGQSADPEETALQASRARAAGITLFAIGVGSGADRLELERIASAPTGDHVFQVDTYDALASIMSLLSAQTCKVTEPPTPPPSTTTTTTTTTTLPPTTTTPPPTTTKEPMLGDAACGLSAPVDIMFALPHAANQHHKNYALRFIRYMVMEFDIRPQGVRVGLVPQECAEDEGFELGDAQDKYDLMTLLQGSPDTKKGTSSAIKSMRLQNFRQHQGHVRVKRVGVVIVDSSEAVCGQAILEAQWARQENDLELFIVAVGKHATSHQVELLASQPVNDHIVYASSYSDLFNVVQELSVKINSYCAGS